jgi:hypothetical protein
VDIENGKKDVASLSEKEEIATSTNHHLNNLANRIKDKIAVRLYNSQSVHLIFSSENDDKIL